MVIRIVLLIEAGLVLSAAVMAAKILRTEAAPPESEQGVITRLAWTNRRGEIEQVFDLDGRYVQPRISRDGASVLLRRMPGPGCAEDWKFTFANHGLNRVDTDPEWTAARGHLQFSEEVTIVPEDRSPDGHWFAFSVNPNWMNFRMHPSVHWNEPFLVDTASGTARRLFDEASDGMEIRFSPDGARIALISSRSGRKEVYTALLSSPNPLVRISKDGGHAPEWGPHDELFFIDTNGDVRTPDHALFHLASIAGPEFEYRYGGYSVGPDGRFLITLLKRATSPR
jgi:hypothetical protein